MRLWGELFRGQSACFRGSLTLAVGLAVGALLAWPAASARATDTSQVEISNSAAIPLHITNFQVDHSPAGMTAFHYSVQNASGQGLVAVEIRWQAYFASDHVAAFSNRDDRWLTGLLPTNQTEQFQVTNVPNLPAQEPMTRLVATITYAEFEDGTALGADASRVGREITQARQAELAAYAKLLDTFNTGGSEALVQALNQDSAAHGQNPAVQASTARLLGILADQGVDAVVLELQRVSTLTLPEPPLNDPAPAIRQ